MASESVLAVFSDPATAAAGIRAVRGPGRRVSAVLPAPYVEVMQALQRPPSSLPRITLVGAILGAGIGFALTIGTSRAWPLLTGGKPIVSLPPFLIVVFELTVLVGSLATLAAGAVLGRLRPVPPYDPRLSEDRIGVLVSGGDLEQAAGALEAAGAEEVRRV